MQITLRPLTRKDRRVFGNLLVKLVEKTGRKGLREMVPSTNVNNEKGYIEADEVTRNAKILEMAFGLLEGMLSFLDDDLSEWFVDLVNEVETIDDFDKLGFNADLDVIGLLLEKEDFIDFFSKGSLVYNGIKGLASRLKNSKTL